MLVAGDNDLKKQYDRLCEAGLVKKRNLVARNKNGQWLIYKISDYGSATIEWCDDVNKATIFGILPMSVKAKVKETIKLIEID